jgi:hypothetical protein
MAKNPYGYGLDFENPYGRNTTGHTENTTHNDNKGSRSGTRKRFKLLQRNIS